MKQIVIVFVLSIIIASTCFAVQGRELFGDINGYLEIKHEDDNADADKTVLKSKLRLEKSFDMTTFSLVPFYYFEDESYVSAFNPNDSKEIENELGLDARVFQNKYLGFIAGLSYVWKTRPTGNNDRLVVSKIKLDF